MRAAACVMRHRSRPSSTAATPSPKSIQLEHEKTWLASQNEWFYSSILSLDIDGKVENVLLRDMQRHPYKQQIMHLDFQRVSENEAIRVAVPLHFLNVEKSPAGKTAGVVVTHELNEDPDQLPAEGPAGVHRDRPGEPERRRHRSTCRRSSCRRASKSRSSSSVQDHDVAVVVARHVREEVEEAADRGRRRSAGRNAEAAKPRAKAKASNRCVPGRLRACLARASTMAGLRLIVGLGNPGPEHLRTRHNAGFWFVDALALQCGARFGLESKLFGETARSTSPGSRSGC